MTGVQSSDIRRESVCSAASKRLSFATSDVNASTYHENDDTKPPYLYSSRRHQFCLTSMQQACRFHRNLAAMLTAKMVSPQQHFGSNCRGVLGKKALNVPKLKAIYNACMQHFPLQHFPLQRLKSASASEMRNPIDEVCHKTKLPAVDGVCSF